MSGAHGELIRLFGEENVHAVRIKGLNYYEIKIEVPPPIDAQWSGEIPHDSTDHVLGHDHEGQFADDEPDKPHHKADCQQMYLSLLEKLGIDWHKYKEHINKDRLVIKIEDLENFRALGVLKMLADNYDKEAPDRDPALILPYRDALLEAQEAAHLDARQTLPAEPAGPPVAKQHELTPAEILAKLRDLTRAEWKKIDTEAGPAYQTMKPVQNKYAAALALSEVFERPEFSDTFKPRQKDTAESGLLTIPHSQISQKELQACHDNYSDYFQAPVAVRKV